jgi:V8-like Glu-specific endopeptidase
MVKLEPSDRATVVKLLSEIDQLVDPAGRKELLVAAGLGPFAAKVDLTGAENVFLGRLVDYLGNFGRPAPDAEALGMLLNWVKTMVGVEQQELLAELMRRYDMMVPLANLPRVDHWGGKRDENQISEKIIGDSTLRPIAFLERGIEVSRAVAYIGLPVQAGSGSGFLVASDLLLTNAHVLVDRANAEASIYRFNFQNNWAGNAQAPAEVGAKPGGVFVRNEVFDFSLVELAGDPGATWGWIPLVPGKIGKDSRINIIQHPGGQPKQISIQNNFVEYWDDKVVQYVTSTMPGSSGSPAFDDSWNIVALHHAGGMLPEAKTNLRHFRNEGIRIDAILKALPAEIAARVSVARR